MLKKLFAVALSGALCMGVATASTPVVVGDVTPIDCLDHCAPAIVLPNGTTCVLAGCLDADLYVICAYNCFYVLPPGPPLF